MSFFNRFTKIIANQPAPKGTQKKSRPVKKTHQPQPKSPKKSRSTDNSPASREQLILAQAKAQELIIEAKNQAYDIKRQADLASQKIISETQQLKNKAMAQESELNHRSRSLEQQSQELTSQKKALEEQTSKIHQIKTDQLAKLKKISKLSQEDAKELILKAYQKRMTRDIAETISEAKKKAKAEAEVKSKEILVEAIRHGATDYVAEYTVSVVKIKDDDMKGRIIGREGRNIRTFEKVTGVEVDLDEAGVIRLSCFDSVRREIARVSLEKLLADGRVQPSRIEEVVKRTTQEIDKIIHQEGEKLCHTVKVFNLPVEIVNMLGRFKYRFSYGQSMIVHTLEETKIGIKLAHEVGADVNIVRLGCLLHDIGKVINDEEGTHVELGVKFLKKFKMPKAVVDCVEQHHEDKPFSSIESMLVYTADAISGARPGARYSDHEGYIERMTQLEDIANSFEGIKNAFALQAGREVRVTVKPDQVDEDSATKLASDIKDKIQQEVEGFPGQIKVTVIRETRSEAIVK